MSKRIDKLCAVKERAVDAAERALARARAATAAAEHAVRATEQAWVEVTDRARTASTVDDLAMSDNRGKTLRQAVQRAEANLKAKRAEEEALRKSMAAARTELRRFEIWGERADAALLAATSRLTRNAEDALAARNKKDP